MIFFFNATPTTEIYTLSLHDALPISARQARAARGAKAGARLRNRARRARRRRPADRKSTRLNSSHVEISYAVFCLKKKKDVSIKLLGDDTVCFLGVGQLCVDVLFLSV